MKRFPATGPVEFIAVTVLAPPPKTTKRNGYVFVLTNRYFELIRVIPTSNTTSVHFANLFLGYQIVPFGISRLFHVCTNTDQQDEREEILEDPSEVERSVLPVYDALPVSMKNVRKTKLQVLLKAIKNISEPLSEIVRHWFMVDVCGKKWKRHPAMISYSCNISKNKDTSSAKRGAKRYPCIVTLISKHDICELRIGPTQIAHVMNDVFKSYTHQ